MELICKYGENEAKEFFVNTNKFIYQEVGGKYVSIGRKQLIG